VFFVISGFLITTLLLKEWSDTGRISLRDFYLRRLFRIFPACYVFLLVMAILNWTGSIQLRPNDLLCGFTYTINNHPDRSWSVGHLWSLSVEEQFYIMWPMVLYFFGRLTGFRVALGVFLAAPLFRMTMLLFIPASRNLLGSFFPTIADAIAAGCMLAYLQTDLSRSQKYRAFISSWRFSGLVLGILVLAYPISTKLSMLVEQSLLNLAIAICIHRCVLIPDDWIGRILNSRGFSAAGVLSYSLYLWQQPFINRESSAIMQSFPANVLLAMAAAVLSYRLVEKPFLKLKKRFERDKTQASPPAASVA
jgi:peptidoglycan/LPS O-acetylase OafA/YrhL